MEIHKDAVIIVPSHIWAETVCRTISFLYLTGLKEAEAVLVLDPRNPRETIFRRTQAPGPGRDGRNGRPEAA
jgi:hypothetical protein